MMLKIQMNKRLNLVLLIDVWLLNGLMTATNLLQNIEIIILTVQGGL